MADEKEPKNTSLAAFEGDLKKNLDAGKTKAVNTTLSDRLYKEAVDKQAQELYDALQKLKTSRAELKKVDRPDQVSFDEYKKEIKAYSKEAIKAIRDAQQRVDNNETYINAALEGDFSKLQKVK